MAIIYTDSQGRQVYDFNGKVIDAKTGQVVTGGGTAGSGIDPFASGTPSLQFGAVNSTPSYDPRAAAAEEAAKVERARQDAIVNQARQIVNSGGGSGNMQSYYNSLAPGDRGLVQGIFGSNLSAPAAPSSGVTSSGSVNAVDPHINAIMDAVVASGYTINPALTPEQLAAIDPATFLAQAEASLTPYYKQKFQTTKEDLTRTLGELGYDLNLKQTDLTRTSKESTLTGDETLAGRGLAFSSTRSKFQTDTADQLSRDMSAAQTTATRSAQDASSKAEGLLGTAEFGTASLPSVGSYTPSSSYSSPLVGSLQSERQYSIEAMGKELQTQDAINRAYASRSLSFG